MTKIPSIQILPQGNSYVLQVQGLITNEKELETFREQFRSISAEFEKKLHLLTYDKDSHRERLIRLFMMDAKPGFYILTWNYRRKTSSYSKDWPLLREMMREGTVKLIRKDSRTKTFQYLPK